MSSPEGVMRAELFMRVLPHRGVPPRGSFRDRVAQEMILRERRRLIAGAIYQAQFLAAGLNIVPGLFEEWTALYVDEVTHSNYQPSMVSKKRRLLDAFTGQRREQARQFARADSYTVTSHQQLRPYTKQELEELQKKLRRRAVQDATRE